MSLRFFEILKALSHASIVAWLTLICETFMLQVRMQSEGKLPEGVPKKYPNAIKAYGIIARSVSVPIMPGIEESRVKSWPNRSR